MLLALSVRIAEDFRVKDRALMPFEGLIQMASEIGYTGICMRASQAGISTPPDRIASMRALLEGLGLRVTMVTGDVSLAANDSGAVKAIRNIVPYLDLADRFGAPLVRVMMQTPEDIPWAREAAAAASERGLTLAHQMHVGTLFESIDQALEIVSSIGPKGFGITYEPANMLVCGQDWGPNGIARLGPFMVNVYLQNHRLDPKGAILIKLRQTSVRVESLALDAPGGIDLNLVFEGLRAIAYKGPVTVHQSAVEGLAIETAARRYFEILAPLIGAASRAG